MSPAESEDVGVGVGEMNTVPVEVLVGCEVDVAEGATKRVPVGVIVAPRARVGVWLSAGMVVAVLGAEPPMVAKPGPPHTMSVFPWA
jgi:hypothetical protein